MKEFSAFLITMAMGMQVQALPSETCNQNIWVTNGPVYAIAPVGRNIPPQEEEKSRAQDKYENKNKT